MDDVIEKPMSVEEFDALPESLLPHQYIEGKLILSPAPERPHQRAVIRLSAALESHVEAHPELGEVYGAPFDIPIQGAEGPERYQPDVMFFARAHLAERLTERRAVGAPDLAVEVLSPGTQRYDLNQKRLGYARSGVTELWIVDPKRQEVHVYLLQRDAGRPACTVKSTGTLRTELLPGFELPVNRLFES